MRPSVRWYSRLGLGSPTIAQALAKRRVRDHGLSCQPNNIQWGVLDVPAQGRRRLHQSPSLKRESPGVATNRKLLERYKTSRVFLS